MTELEAPLGFPTLDRAARYGLIGDLVNTIEPHTEADPAALAMNALVMFGNCVGCGPHAVADGAEHPARFFAVIVGNTSRGRKDTALKRARAPFAQADQRWAKDCAISSFGSGEAPIAILQARTDRRMMLNESEYSKVLRVAGREGNTLSAVLREAWDGSTLRVTTKKDPLEVSGAHVSIIGNITESELHRNLTDVEVANGFGNRNLFVSARRQRLLPEGGAIPDEDFSRLVLILRQRLERARAAQTLRRDPEATELWATLYEKMADSELDGLAGALTSRAEAQVLRLSVAYALTDGCRTIKRQHLEAAWAMWRYCEDSVVYIFGNATGDPIADRLLTALRQAGANGLDATQQSRVFTGHRDKNALDMARKLLTSKGLAYIGTVPTTGRPRTVLYAKEAKEDDARRH
jgi:hypothetical protein